MRTLGTHHSSYEGFLAAATRRHIAVLGLAGAGLLLAGCAAKPVVTTVAVTLTAGADANPDARGRASPLTVRVYALKSPGPFEGADFFSLFEKDQATLGAELVQREKIDVLAGAFLSNTGLALTDFAKQKKFFYLAAEPLTDKIVWSNGNKYTYRLRPSTYMQVAMLVPEAAKLKKKRWALVYPNYEYGQSSVATFKTLLKAAQPDVEFVAEQAPPLGKVDSGSVVQALADAKPDAIFNVLFGADLSKFVREGNTRGLFKDREVVSVLTGEPEYLDPLKDEAPNGWIVTGYPWNGVKTPEHKAFLDAYQAKFKDYPRLGSVVGYSAIHSIAAGIKKAGGTDTEKLVAAFKGLQVDTPFGKISYRAQDNQSTMGAYVGKTKNDGGKGVMVGMRAALAHVIARFEPAELEKKISAKTALDALFSANRKAKLWDQFVSLYGGIASEAEDDFHSLFGTAFLEAYEEQMARLKSDA